MTEIFLYIVNMSITATILAVVVLFLRLLLKKAPKWISVLLWGLVALRLICPFAVESPFSLMPKTDWVVQEPLTEENFFLDSVPDTIPAFDSSSFGSDVTVQYSYYPLENSNIEIHRGISISFILSCIWAAGMAALLLHTVISTIRLRKSVGAAIRIQDNVWESSAVESPFVLGMIRPRIYVPRGMSEEKLAYVIAHEQAHIRRKDHWWKPLGFLLLTIHWFNPVLWLAYILLCRDIEMACDERVIKEYDDVQRADYSEALLDCSVKRKMITACPLAFGEVSVKERIKSVLHYKKPAFWIVVLAVVACVVAAVCFLTNPNAGGDYICRIVDDSFHKVAVYSTLTEPFIDDELRDELLLDVVRDNYKSFKEPLSLEIQNTTYMLYNGKDTAVYTVKVNDSEDFTSICLAYIQPRGNKEPLGQVKIDGNENAEQLQYIESNISGEKLSYEILKQHQEEIWAYRTAAINDTVDEVFRKWGERIAAVGVNAEHNCVDVYVYDFDEGDIGRFQKALGHLSYVLIQKDDAIEMIPDDKKQLTLEDVIELSAKGYDLTWEDFYEFKSIETGSGLYIRVYEIDETFSVWIGGGAPIGTPMYIYLTAHDLDTRIDIRDGGVEEFVENMSTKQASKEIENIIFHSDRGGSAQALEGSYSDEKYDYYFPTIRNYVTIVYYKDGTEQTVKDALAEGKITITDLDRFNIRYYREPKQGYELSRLITVAEVSEEALLGTEYYEYIHDQNEYTRYILISPTEKITDVRVTDIVLDAGLEFGDVLYVLSALDSNKPLLLGVVFYGDFTSYGIVFRDSDGVAHRFIISESGEDGSVAVQEHYFFGDV